MEDFFGRLARRWPPGPDHEHYHWHVLWDPETMAKRLYDPYTPVTHQDGLAAVRPQWMHMTILHGPPVADLSDSDRDDITGLVRDGCARIGPSAVTVAGPQAWHNGLVCPVVPAEQVRRLWQVTIDATRQVTGDRHELRPDPFGPPHVTLAYPTGHVDDRSLRVWLADNPTEPAVLPLTRLSLVAQQHNGREITWRLIDEVWLQG